MEPTLVKQFTIGPDGLRLIKNSYLKGTLTMLPFIVIPILISGLGGSTTFNGVRQSQFVNNLTGATFITIIFLISLFIQRRLLDGKYGQYTIRLNDQLIEKRVLASQKTVLINVADINRITRMYNGNLYIYYDKSSPLFIPRQIENRDELETTLKALGVPFFAGPYNFFARHVNLILLIAAGFVIADFFTSNKWFISIDSTVLLSVIFTTFIIARRRSKKNSSAKPLLMPYLVSAGVVLFILLVKLFR